MEELKEILSLIIKITNENNEKKNNLLKVLWTRYYILKNKLNITIDEEYNTILSTNDGFIINQPFIKNEIDYKLLYESINKIENSCGINENEALNILNWTIENTKNNLSTILNQLGKDVNKDSLEGFCEVAQTISLMPLEKIGLKVTKNRSQDCFNYPYNHAFGTVTFDMLTNNEMIKKTYIIDLTYRQFFKISKCNEGIYYEKDVIAPDPGYFANEEFAKELLKNGYIELTKKNAILYGMPFYKSSIALNYSMPNIDFQSNILDIHGEYSSNATDLEGFNMEIKTFKKQI